MRTLYLAAIAALGCNLVSGLDEFAIPATASGTGGQVSASSASSGGGAPKPCVLGVTAHRHQSCARLADGSVWCWGDNSYGQLGDGTGVTSAVPVRAQNLPPIRDVVTAGTSAFALGEDGRVYAWGSNAAGQLGVGHTGTLLAPQPIPSLANIARIAAGNAHACAIDIRDNLYCWGSNQHGQVATANALELQPVQIMAGIRGIAAGSIHTCALDINGRVLCWGSNGYAQLGSPNNVIGSPMQVDGTLLAVEVVSSGMLTCARSTGGRVFCWGYNLFGQAGDAAAGTTVPSPREVAGVRDPVGLAVSGRRACALTGSGAVWCWGELGVSAPQSPAPVNVAGPTHMTILEGATAIGLASYHACALLPDGLSCIGTGTSGELGHGSLETTGRFVRPALPCDAR